MNKIYLDACVLVAFFSEHKEEKEKKEIVNKFFRILGELEIFVSKWAIAEMMNVMLSKQKQDNSYVQECESILLNKTRMEDLKFKLIGIGGKKKNYDFDEFFYDVRGIILKYHPGVGDAIHSVIMKNNNINQILTFNQADFENIEGITVINPEIVIEANKKMKSPKMPIDEEEVELDNREYSGISGIKTKKFLDCLEKEASNNKFKIQAKDFLEKGRYPIIDQGKDFIAGFTNDKNKVYSEKLPVIIFGDHTRTLKFVNFPFALGADGVKILVPSKEFNPAFFYYYLSHLQIPSAGYSRHYKYLKKKIIPIPPLDVQNRIVQILETEFSRLNKTIENLKLIKNKIRIYRHSVLKKSFEKKTDWKEVELGEISLIGSGQGAPQGDKWFKGDNVFVRAGDLNKLSDGVHVGDHCGKITEEAIKKYDLKKYPAGSVVFPKSGMSIMTGNTAILKYDSYVVNHLAIIQTNKNIDHKFIYYLLKKTRPSNLSNSSNYPSIKISNIRSLKIPLPPLPEQKRIVEETEQKFSVIYNVEKIVDSSLKKSESLRRSILKTAFEGEIIKQEMEER